MPQGRMLKKKISNSKTLGKLKGDSARLLYTWLIPHLDCKGRYSADPELIKGHIFPKVKTMTLGKIKKLIAELAEASLIIHYRNDREEYLELINFNKEQKIYETREAESEIPNPKEENIIKYDSTHVNSCNLMQSHENSSLSKVKESKVKESKDNVRQILAYLNQKTGKNFKEDPNTKNAESISARLNDGFTVEQLKRVIDNKVPQWLHDPKMNQYLRPKTLFGPEKFEGYLNEKPIKKSQAGKNIHEPSQKEKEYLEKKKEFQKKLQKKYQAELDKARKDGNREKYDEIQKKIGEEVAQFSRDYFGEK